MATGKRRRKNKSDAAFLVIIFMLFFKCSKNGVILNDEKYMFDFENLLANKLCPELVLSIESALPFFAALNYKRFYSIFLLLRNKIQICCNSKYHTAATKVINQYFA